MCRIQRRGEQCAVCVAPWKARSVLISREHAGNSKFRTASHEHVNAGENVVAIFGLVLPVSFIGNERSRDECTDSLRALRPHQLRAAKALRSRAPPSKQAGSRIQI